MAPTSIRKKIDKLTAEARARVTWGEPVDVVRTWLAKERVADWQIDDILRDLLAERGASMRRRGVRGIFVGVPILACAAAVGWLPQALEKHGIPAIGRELGLFYAAAFLIGVVGVKQLVDGVERVLRGAAAEGADSDVSDR